jgi:hypothetical protein
MCQVDVGRMQVSRDGALLADDAVQRVLCYDAVGDDERVAIWAAKYRYALMTPVADRSVPSSSDRCVDRSASLGRSLNRRSPISGVIEQVVAPNVGLPNMLRIVVVGIQLSPGFRRRSARRHPSWNAFVVPV